MAMQTDVKSAACAAGTSTTAFGDRTRIKALTISYPTAGGTVTVKNGDTNGDTLFSFTSPAAVGCVHILIPGEGILATSGLYVTCAANTTAVAYYG